MRIIEGHGPPSTDTFGNQSYLYKDLDTGKFYRCHGNINEERAMPYGPAHKHPGEQYLWTPTDGSGNGGVSSWNDLTDKPFGESENAVLLPPTQFAYDSAFGLFAIPGYIDFVLGKTYTVKWNGVDYETTAVAGAFNGESLVMVGNPAALGGANNNLPFAVACLMGSIGAIPLDGSTAVNVGISGYWFAKVPEKYLPKTRYDLQIDELPAPDTDGSYALSLDTTELVDAVLAGANIYITYKSGPSSVILLASIIMPITLGEDLAEYVKQHGKEKVTFLLTCGAGELYQQWSINYND